MESGKNLERNLKTPSRGNDRPGRYDWGRLIYGFSQHDTNSRSGRIIVLRFIRGRNVFNYAYYG